MCDTQAMTSTTPAHRFNCNRCKDTGARYHKFYDGSDRSLCDCSAGDWKRLPENERIEIVAYITALEMAQRKADRHARRAARQAAEVV